MQLYKLNERIEKAGSPDFGDILSRSINLFKKVWLKGFVTFIILAVITFVVGFLLSMIGLGESYDYNSGLDFNVLNNFSIQSLYTLPQTIIISSSSIALVAGFYRMCKQEDMGGAKNDDYFYFFKREFIGKIMFLGIIYSVIATVTQILFMIPYIYACIPLSYFTIIFANNPELSEADIVKASFNIGTKKWLISFGSLFVCGIIALLGLVACFIGILFTASIVYLPLYFIYKDVVGFDEHSEILEIGTE